MTSGFLPRFAPSARRKSPSSSIPQVFVPDSIGTNDVRPGYARCRRPALSDMALACQSSSQRPPPAHGEAAGNFLVFASSGGMISKCPIAAKLQYWTSIK